MQKSFDGLILPGGESTVQGMLIKELGLYDGLKERIQDGMPVLATCAGLILLAEELANDPRVYFGTLPVKVKRNAYGRQLGSFHTVQKMDGIGIVPMTFIRAPYIEETRGNAQTLASVRGNIVAVKCGTQYAMSFHPELDEDNRIHQAFLNAARN